MWVDSENGRKAGREKQGGQTCGRGRQLKSVLFTFFFLCLFVFLPIYDDYDMMRFLVFSCFLYGGRSKAVWFGLGGVGKKRFGLVLGFVVLCLDWEGWRERKKRVFVV